MTTEKRNTSQANLIREARDAFRALVAERLEEMTITRVTDSKSDDGWARFRVTFPEWPNHPVSVRLRFNEDTECWEGRVWVALRELTYVAQVLEDQMRGDLEPRVVVESMMGTPIGLQTLRDQVSRDLRVSWRYLRDLRRRLSTAKPGQPLERYWAEPPSAVIERHGDVSRAKRALCGRALARRGLEVRGSQDGKEWVVRVFDRGLLRSQVRGTGAERLAW